MNAGLNCVGLFAGIGGLESGLHRSGHRTELLCEIDPAARAVLARRFPEIPIHSDVVTLKSLLGNTDLLAGGFSCQDLSQAGRTAGIEGPRSGLIGEVFRLLQKTPVPWVLLENVPFMLQLDRGRAMELIVTALEELGYKWAYRVVDSRAFGVPQRRERVYLLASLREDPREILLAPDAGEPIDGDDWRKYACGFYWTEGIRGLGWAINAIPTLKGGSGLGIPSQPAIVFPDGRVGKPEIRDAERLQGFDADWTLPAEEVASRGARWKLVGNAVTVGAAEWIGRQLQNPHPYRSSADVSLCRKNSWPRAAWNVGTGRRVSLASAFPVACPAPSLAKFLHHPVEPLSEKATRGFLARTEISSLHFPHGFIDVLRAHLRMMEAPAAA